MAKITGIGGVFVTSKDPEKLAAWYRDRLGFPVEAEGTHAVFSWADGGGDGCTVWSVFEERPEYFAPTAAPYMLNLRVDDLDGLLAELAAAGDVWIDERRDDQGYGRFAWIKDPDGNRIELWEPARA